MYFLQGLLLSAAAVAAQAPPAAQQQSSAFNSTFALSASQIAAANLSATQAASLNNVISFDRSQLANGGPHEDDFYSLPPPSSSASELPPPPRAGALLKVQAFTDPTPFVVPPNTALSRILYTTKNLNGTVLPASAFVLWPFQARTFPGRSSAAAAAPTVLWTHGTSGFFAPAAPSSHRALWYGNSAPFTLAQAGYAVVAPDYAGLGVSRSWDGSRIPHEYLASPAGAQDALYALRAAREAFGRSLTPEFAVMGHSQGGGVAWATAELLASRGEEFADLAGGYLGAIAGSPTTDLFSGVPEFILPWVGMVLDTIFPGFELSEWLTPLGIARTELLRQVEGSIGVSQQLFLTGEGLIREGWRDTWHVPAYAGLADAGRKPFRGPLLVLQGTRDAYIPYAGTTSTVRGTCGADPGNNLEYLVVNGTQHVPTLDATRQIWLQWIQDRFEAVPLAEKGCVRTDIESFLPLERYQSTGNSFPLWAGAPEYAYEVPLGL